MKWISVKDKLPPENEWLYFGNSKGQMVTWGIYLEGKFVNPDLNYSEIIGISHWMPLPEPPNK